MFVDTGFMYSGMLYQDADSQARFVTRTAKTLRRHPDFADLFSIPNARTPIVQVFHHPTRLDCDLSFRHGLSVENTEFLKCVIITCSVIYSYLYLYFSQTMYKCATIAEAAHLDPEEVVVHVQNERENHHVRTVHAVHFLFPMYRLSAVVGKDQGT